MYCRCHGLWLRRRGARGVRDHYACRAEDCQWDYHNFCDQYAIGSDLLDMCFKQNGPKLFKPCVDALIAAGDTSQEYVDQQKKLLGR